MRRESGSGDDSAPIAHEAADIPHETSPGFIVRTFTVEEVSCLIPDLRRQLRWLREIARALLERKREIQLVLCNGSCSKCDCGLKAYKEELVASVKHLQDQSQLIGEKIDALRQRGIIVRSVVEGIVDFPAFLNGQLVFLCWQIDEPTILFWHPVSEGFGSRRPLENVPTPVWSSSAMAPAVAPI